MGRQSEYNETIGKAICERLAEGESLRTVCLDDAMPVQSTVFKWIAANREFEKQYASARESQMECMAEEILAIADDGLNDTYETDDGEKVNTDVIQRSKLRVDTRKWLMSKMAPKKYGDRTTVAGDPDAPIGVQYTVKSILDKE